MKSVLRLVAPLLLAAAAVLPVNSWATNGYFTHGVSIKEKAMAGTGVALSQDTLAAANNPAGMVMAGPGIDLGLAFFSPNRKYKAEGGPSVPAGTPLSACAPQCPFSIGDGDQSITSENTLFLIPQFGYNWKIRDNNSIGLSLYANGGMNTKYEGGVAVLPNPTAGTMVEAPGTYGDGTAGVDLAQLFLATTYAHKFAQDRFSVGASLLLAYQQFSATGLGNFAGFSTDPQSLSNNGQDDSTGVGIRLGIWGEIVPGVTLGAAYQPKIDMTEFNDYAGLFAEQGDFDIPSNYTVGAAWQFLQRHTLLLDVQGINYEDVAAVSNPIEPLQTDCTPGATGGSGSGCLGASDGAGFGWQNMTILKLGYQLQAGSGWSWRFGYSYAEQPIPSSQTTFNILAPGVMEQHLTGGFTKDFGQAGEFNLAFMYAPSKSVSGQNTFDPAQEITLEMYQYELSIGYGRRF